MPEESSSEITAEKIETPAESGPIAENTEEKDGNSYVIRPNFQHK